MNRIKSRGVGQTVKERKQGSVCVRNKRYGEIKQEGVGAPGGGGLTWK